MWNAAMSIGILNARLLTLCDSTHSAELGVRPAVRSGRLAQSLEVIACASVLVEQGCVETIAEGAEGAEFIRRGNPRTMIDARGRVLMPGFVDSHTHACWAGNRLDEWLYNRQGRTYLDILKGGGGIMSTVRSVRAARQDVLTEELLTRLRSMLREGSTTIEVKSGYGLSTEAELKMLRAIRDAAAHFEGTVVSTALIGHAIDPEFAGGTDSFVEYVISDTLPSISREFPGITVDAYCEIGAWSVNQTVRLFTEARRLGHPIRVHADQFNALGMTGEAIRMGAISVDHLEASTESELAELAACANTFGVILPVCGFHVDDRYANGRGFCDASTSSKLCIATNFNPGSAPCGSMPATMALAVRKCGLWPAEAISAVTVNPACMLGFADRGIIARGLRADLILSRHTDERNLAYEFGLPAIDAVMCGGKLVQFRAAG